MTTNIEMAREAGFVEYELEDYTQSGYDIRYERFAALVRADEREACAAQLDFNAQAASNGGDEYIAALLWQEAEELRARGNT